MSTTIHKDPNSGETVRRLRDTHPLLDTAINIAKKAHAGQFRKDGRTPYIVHPLAVMEILVQSGIDDPLILAAAVLHDVLEDTPYPSDMLNDAIGPVGTGLVLELTKVTTRATYVDNFCDASPEACLVKLADRLHNLQDWTPEMGHGFRRTYVAESLVLVARILSNKRWRAVPIHRVVVSRLATQILLICASDVVLND